MLPGQGSTFARGVVADGGLGKRRGARGFGCHPQAIPEAAAVHEPARERMGLELAAHAMDVSADLVEAEVLIVPRQRTQLPG
jgi:hypothetical protein